MSIVLENDSVQDKQLGSVILQFMNIPYFSNNPWYLSLWKRVYSIRPDEGVLFLMHMKGIGLLSSWLYLRLHEHFVQKGCVSCANAILIEGIKASAYPSEELEEKVSYSIKKEHALERPSKIKVFGREWTHTTKYAHPQSTLRKEGECITYMEYRIIQYLRKTKRIDEEETEKGLNEVSLLFGSMKSSRIAKESDSTKEAAQRKETLQETGQCEKKRTHEVENTKKTSIGLESVRDGSAEKLNLENYRTESAPLAKKIKVGAESDLAHRKMPDILSEEIGLNMGNNIEDIYKEAFSEIVAEESRHERTNLSMRLDKDVLESTDELYERQGIILERSSFGSPIGGSKLVIGNILYIVKKNLGSASFLVTRLASLGDGNLTLNARDYTLRSISNSTEYSISKALEKTRYSIPIEVAVKYSDQLVVLSAYKEMGSLATAIRLITEREGYLPELLAAHYIREILEIGLDLEKTGYDISQCGLEDFMLVVEDGKIAARVAEYKNIKIGGKYAVHSSRVFATIVERVKIENTQGLLTHPLSPASWMTKIEAYLAQKKEASLLQNLFIAQEVCIYEEGQLE